MKILKEARYKDLLRTEEKYRRFMDIYWLSEFQWLTEPFREYVETGDRGISVTREKIRLNKQQLNEDKMKIIKEQSTKIGQLKNDLTALKKTIQICKEEGK